MKLLEPHKPRLSKREEHMVNAMHALGDKTRFSMFKLLLKGNEMCVSEIADHLNISTPAVSQHFRIFELVGLVDRERYGQKICYKLKPNNSLVQELAKFQQLNKEIK